MPDSGVVRRPHRHGQAPREVRLDPHTHEWRPQIWRAWAELVVAGVMLDYQIVAPRPPATDPQVAAHVILIQRPIENWVTSIVSSIDVGNANQDVRQLAITTLDQLTSRGIREPVQPGLGSTEDTHRLSTWDNRVARIGTASAACRWTRL